MARKSLRSQLYRAARDLGNVEAAERGPASYGKRVIRRGSTEGRTAHSGAGCAGSGCGADAEQGPLPRSGAWYVLARRVRWREHRGSDGGGSQSGIEPGPAAAVIYDITFPGFDHQHPTTDLTVGRGMAERGLPEELLPVSSCEGRPVVVADGTATTATVVGVSVGRRLRGWRSSIEPETTDDAYDCSSSAAMPTSSSLTRRCTR